MNTLQLLGDRVAIRRDPVTKLTGRIHLPDRDPDEGNKSLVGVVTHVGEGPYSEAIKVGDRVRLKGDGRGHDLIQFGVLVTPAENVLCRLES